MTSEQANHLLDKIHALQDKVKSYQRYTDTIITLLEIEEVSDEGLIFRPNRVTTSRVGDGQRINEALTHLKMLNK